MSDLTLKAIEQMLDAKLQPIKTGMAHLATQDSLNHVSDRLTTIEGIFNQHTTTLDAIDDGVPDEHKTLNHPPGFNAEASTTPEKRSLTRKDQLFLDIKEVIGRGLVSVARAYLKHIDQAGLRIDQGDLQKMLQERINSARGRQPDYYLPDHIISEGETVTQLLEFAKEQGIEVS